MIDRYEVKAWSITLEQEKMNDLDEAIAVWEQQSYLFPFSPVIILDHKEQQIIKKYIPALLQSINFNTVELELIKWALEDLHEELHQHCHPLEETAKQLLKRFEEDVYDD